MNKIHSTVWSHARQCYVVAHEKAATGGGPASTVAGALTAVALVLGTAPAQAACGASDGSTVQVSGAQTGSCTLSNGSGITVDASASVSASGLYVPAVAVKGSGTTASAIVNHGTLKGDSTAAIEINGGTAGNGMTYPYPNPGAHITGGILNHAGGLIQSPGTNSAALKIVNAQVDNGIVNHGTIRATSTKAFLASALLLEHSTVNGGIVNTGLMEGNDAISIYNDSVIHGGILNEGVIRGGLGGGAASSGLYIWSPLTTIDGDIINRGTIANANPRGGRGMLIEGSTVAGGIDNSGTIQARGHGLELLGVSMGGLSGVSGNVSIRNTGTIQTEDAGWGDESGIRVGNTFKASQLGDIVNTGTIQGFRYGINIDGSNSSVGNLHNSGVIGGRDYAVFVGGTAESPATLSHIYIEGNDSAKFLGAVYAPNTPVTVASDASYTLRDGNHFTTPSFTNAGTLKVGADSTAAITGNFTTTGVFSPAVAGMTSYGKVNVSGTATLGGDVSVNVLGIPQLTAGAVLNGVIHADAGVTGSFAQVKTNSLLFSFEGVYDPNDFGLKIIAAQNASVRSSVEEQHNTPGLGAAVVLDQVVQGNAPAWAEVRTALGQFSTSQQVSQAVSQTLPTMQGALSQAGGNVLRSMNKVIQSRIESNLGLSSGDAVAERHLWVRALGNHGNQNDRNGASGFRSNTAGFIVGADAPVNDKLLLGGAFTYAKSQIKSSASAARNRVDVDSYELVGYASYHLGPKTDLNAQIDVGQNQAQSRRDIAFMGTTASADFNSLSWHGSLGVGHTLDLSEKTSVTPSLRADYMHMRTPGYAESGAGVLNLQVQDSTYREFLLSADVKFSHQLSDSLKLVGNGGVGYDFINKQAKTVSTFTGGGAAFEALGLEVSPWVFRLGLGLVKNDRKGVEYSLRYDAEGRSSGYSNHTLSAKARWAF
ncbi:autotransporter domain-containing protein [Comamonas sp. GB3 AK4-5]|uniref:autotransporter family protein n=1 Tax=Comamonas sp. GB3 AK4-5 TaxID=3231487 RepID=UPI00351F38C7